MLVNLSEQDSPLPNQGLKKLEIGAVVLTGLLKIPLMNWWDLKLPYILGVILFWSGYLYWRTRKNPSFFREVGFSKVNHWQTFKMLTPLALLSLLVFALIGYSKGYLLLNWHILPIVLLYPVWGLLQQFLVVGIVAGNLSDLNRYSTFWIVGITAFIFGIVHYPFPILMAGTFLLAILYTLLYLRWRNLWWLGFYHGIVGCFFYFYVMGKDPYAELMLLFG